MSMKEYLFKEISPEYSDFSTFFDDDAYNERGGDYCYTIFVIGERGFCGVNAAEYDALKNEFNNICSELSDIGNEYSYYKSVKELMIDYKLHYTPRAAHELKMIVNADYNGADDTCYGFIIADCQISSDKDYKTILADYIGVKPEAIDVQLISNSYTTQHFDYITV